MQASTAEAKRLSEGFVAVADHASPSVVQIDVTARDEKADLLSHFFGHNGREEPIARGMGSGVVFTSDGAILTNNHVVEEALTINVRLRDGRYLPARLVGRDPATDLAVVKIDATGLTPAKFADSDAARVGEWVVAIGSPFGLGYTVTAGVLSAKGRGGLGMNAIEDYLQTDASINPGNSGGPLCNLSGRRPRHQHDDRRARSGHRLRRAEQPRAARGRSDPQDGPRLARLARRLGAGRDARDRGGDAPDAGGRRARQQRGAGRPGLQGEPAGRATSSPSWRATRCTTAHDLIRETIAREVGQAVPLEIIRGGQHYGASVTLSEREERPVEEAPSQQPPNPHQGMGLIVRDLAPDQAAQMNLPAKPLPVLTQVAPGSAADRAGLRAGDVIVEANGSPDPSLCRSPSSRRRARCSCA